MLLRELYYFDASTGEPTEDKRYDPEQDQTPIDIKDTRKTRLTLRQINSVRKASELHKEAQDEELVFVRQMYGISANADAGGI